MMVIPYRTSIHKLSFFTSSNILIIMNPKYLLNPFPLLPSSPSSSLTLTRLFYTHRIALSPIYSKSISITSPFSLISSRFSSIPHSTIDRAAVSEVCVENPEKMVESVQMRLLVQKLKEIEIDMGSYKPGRNSRLLCPKCKGGDKKEKSFSLFITEDGNSAFWTCFRAKCGWRGSKRAIADGKSSYERMNKVTEVKQLRKITEEDLELEPLCSEVFVDNGVARKGVNQISKVNSSKQLIEERLRLEPLGDELTAYFAERMISKEVLQKNAVMQTSGEKNAIAFPYRRNGELINCKYRSIVNKRFWQEKGAEKILYGLDDIKEVDEIIIVEGEIDKLSMEQAGLLNCVSVPNGAPRKVSNKELPSLDKDTRFQYLWNCRHYFDKASRIILATDGDTPGQVLAEELARRLGKERCWLVSWPKKDEFRRFKDANEVLQNLGPDALRDIIDNAQLYQNKNLN